MDTIRRDFSMVDVRRRIPEYDQLSYNAKTIGHLCPFRQDTDVSVDV